MIPHRRTVDGVAGLGKNEGRAQEAHHEGRRQHAVLEQRQRKVSLHRTLQMVLHSARHGSNWANLI